MPVGFATFFFFPDTPHKTHAWFLSKAECELAIERVVKAGKAAPAKITFDTFKRIFSRWSKDSLRFKLLVTDVGR